MMDGSVILWKTGALKGGYKKMNGGRGGGRDSGKMKEEDGYGQEVRGRVEGKRVGQRGLAVNKGGKRWEEGGEGGGGGKGGGKGGGGVGGMACTDLARGRTELQKKGCQKKKLPLDRS